MARILVVDDHRLNRESLASLLEHAGYEVAQAADGGEALAAIRAHRPDLVISDVLMPAVDGYELARRLRSDPSTAGVPLMFYTAYFGQKDALDLASAYGVSRVMIKPSEPDRIVRAVEELLAAGPQAPASPVQGLDQEHLRVMVDQLLEKTARIERLNRTLSVLSAVSALIVRGPERKDLLAEACRIAVEKGGFAVAWIGLCGADGRLAASARAGDPAAALPQGTFEEVLRARHPVLLGERALAVLPLLVNGEPGGVLALGTGGARRIDEEELRLLVDLAGDISFALEHRAVQDRAHYLAFYDVLTGLPNWSLFADRLAQALRTARLHGQLAGVVFLDIERFRMINDSFGRQAGDECLRQVGARLKAAVREQDTVARVGADHFAVAVAGFDQLDDTSALLLDRLVDAFTRPLMVAGQELRVTLRAGVALYPADGDTAEQLCARADTALKKAKQSGERYLFYAPEMNARVGEALTLENRLRRAVEDERLELHYQPKASVASGEIVGLEALIRWRDPLLGDVAPARFIPLMEETGLIVAAGRWALGRAVADMRRWQAEGLGVPRTAVNVSALQLRQKDFAATVLEAIRPFGPSAPLLDIEITESVIIEDIATSTQKLQALRAAGVEVSVDDFGTGYCSLSYLAKLPVDTLKVDRSFVVGMGESGYSRNIVTMIVSLAHTLGLRVVAEGVEQAEQLRQLRELGCDEMQGFLVGPAVPALDVVALLPRAAEAPRRHILG